MQPSAAYSPSARSPSFGSTWYVGASALIQKHRLMPDQLTSAPPAFGLGMEKAAADSMKKRPHDVKFGVFTWPVVIDCFAYGIVMGALGLFSVSRFFLGALLHRVDMAVPSSSSWFMADMMATSAWTATIHRLISATLSSAVVLPSLQPSSSASCYSRLS